MKKTVLPNLAELWDSTAYAQLGNIGPDALRRHGMEVPGPWDARLRRKWQGNWAWDRHGNHAFFQYANRRDADEWCVWNTTKLERMEGEEFTAVIEEWNAWDYDPTKPFPHTSWFGGPTSVWDDLTGEGYEITLKGSLRGFLDFVDMPRDGAKALIDRLEADGSITVDEATLARLTIK